MTEPGGLHIRGEKALISPSSSQGSIRGRGASPTAGHAVRAARAAPSSPRSAWALRADADMQPTLEPPAVPSDNRLLQLMHTWSTAVFALDSAGNVYFWNRQMAEICHWPHAALNLPVQRVLWPGDRSSETGIMTALKKGMRGHEVESLDVKIVCPRLPEKQPVGGEQQSLLPSPAAAQGRPGEVGDEALELDAEDRVEIVIWTSPMHDLKDESISGIMCMVLDVKNPDVPGAPSLHPVLLSRSSSQISVDVEDDVGVIDEALRDAIVPGATAFVDEGVDNDNGVFTGTGDWDGDGDGAGTTARAPSSARSSADLPCFPVGDQLSGLEPDNVLTVRSRPPSNPASPSAEPQPNWADFDVCPKLPPLCEHVGALPAALRGLDSYCGTDAMFLVDRTTFNFAWMSASSVSLVGEQTLLPRCVGFCYLDWVLEEDRARIKCALDQAANRNHSGSCVYRHIIGLAGSLRDATGSLGTPNCSPPTRVLRVAISPMGGSHIMLVCSEFQTHRLEVGGGGPGGAGSTQQSERLYLRYVLHEVRVPLNAAMIGVKELRARAEASTVAHAIWDEEMRELVQLVDECNYSTRRILDDVLSMQKIEEGKMELEMMPFRVSKLIAASLTTMKSMALEKQIDLVQNVSAQLTQLTLKGDKYRLQQVLCNLISNAIKFSPSSAKIWLSATIEASSPSQVSVRFSVRDQGIGISEANLKKLFAPFVQIAASRAQKGHGSGLGLCISKNIVSMHGGVMQVASKVGEGSDFFFTIPFDRPSGRAMQRFSVRQGKSFAKKSRRGSGGKHRRHRMQKTLSSSMLARYESADARRSSRSSTTSSSKAVFSAESEPDADLQQLRLQRAQLKLLSQSQSQPQSQSQSLSGVSPRKEQLLKEIRDNDGSGTSGDDSYGDGGEDDGNDDDDDDDADDGDGGPRGQHFHLEARRRAAEADEEDSPPRALTPELVLRSNAGRLPSPRVNEHGHGIRSLSASTSPRRPSAHRYGATRRRTSSAAAAAALTRLRDRGNEPSSGSSIYSAPVSRSNSQSFSETSRPSSSESLPSIITGVDPVKAFGDAGIVSSPSSPGFQSAMKMMRVLIVEDSGPSRKIMGFWMKRLGVESAFAVDGLDAIELLKHDKDFDAVLLDQEMPNMDGVAAARTIKVMLPNLPIVGLTGNAFAEDQQLFADAGADYVLTKPVDVPKLTEVLHSFVSSDKHFHARRARRIQRMAKHSPREDQLQRQLPQ